MAVQPPFTATITGEGIHEIRPDISHTDFEYQIVSMNVTNKDKPVRLSLLEGTQRRWSGDLPRNSSIEIDFGPLAWRLKGGVALNAEIEGKKAITTINLLNYSTIRS